MSSYVNAGRQNGFFPSLLLIALASQFMYYFNVFYGTFERCLWRVILAVSMIVVGYFFGALIKLSNNERRIRKATSFSNFDDKLLKRISIVFLLIGIIAHLVYYSSNPITSYGESYGSGRGNGFITVFFNFVPLGLILNEFLISRGKASRSFAIFNRTALLIYCGLYFFCLMKRRQILFLLIAVIAVWGPKIKTSTKVVAYVLGIVLLLLFAVFGKVRGYFDINGLAPTIDYAISNFDWSWLALDEMEGKYISRTLNDVYGYVATEGNDPSVLMGVLFCMIPRALLGGSKPLAFPEWYTYHFHPADFQAGTGYAGSIIGEFYLIGGAPLVFAAFFLVGFVTAKMQIRGKATNDIAGNLIYAIYIYTLLLLPRYDLASLLIDIVFIYIPMIWALRCSFSRPSKETKGELSTIRTDVSERSVEYY